LKRFLVLESSKVECRILHILERKEGGQSFATFLANATLYHERTISGWDDPTIHAKNENAWKKQLLTSQC
jgi:hypothetical protein